MGPTSINVTEFGMPINVALLIQALRRSCQCIDITRGVDM